ncbi:MHJ_0274 family protein [Mycoplasma phocoeninasale]|uniref:Uncharacterized protein n=1 Tax=Mycoplasma phocoeninasale TaxID=2726117 RepID=A0A858U5V6_9MOLU|nr:hypothetical protein [Mycoplasma phocoeninasale]MBN0970787.1 hypothetical protein [Mycoplasma phocoeninasale]QJG66645.1 hypothetical protein HGG64_02975 [Mycoplasma phocoeninasale]
MNNSLANFAETTEAKPSGGIGNSILYSLLAILLLALVAYIIWKIVKGKIYKKRAEKAEKIKAKKTLSLYYEYILSFQEIIEFTQKELESFMNGSSKRKMGEIKEGSKKLLVKLANRNDFSSSFLEKDEYKTFIKNVENINLVQCNLWDKKIPETLEFFKQQYDAVPEGNKKSEYLELVRKSIVEKYYE